MASYFVLTQTVTDLERYHQEYIPGVLPFLSKYGAEVVAAGFDVEPLQGSPAKGAVVLRFPSDQSIRDFLADPAYQPLLELRLSITENAAAVIAPEFAPPA